MRAWDKPEKLVAYFVRVIDANTGKKRKPHPPPTPSWWDPYFSPEMRIRKSIETEANI
jgi:hypothetical protein